VTRSGKESDHCIKASIQPPPHFQHCIEISHASLPAVASSQELIEELSGLLEIGDFPMPFLGVQVGLETGSVRMLKRFMAGKPLPFKPEEWREVVETVLGIMRDNNWIPALTLVVGLPGETVEDVIETTELLDELKSYRSLVVPLFFVSTEEMILRRNSTFGRQSMTREHEEIFAKCLNHSLYWADHIRSAYFDSDCSLMLKLAFSGLMKFIGMKSRVFLDGISDKTSQTMRI